MFLSVFFLGWRWRRLGLKIIKLLQMSFIVLNVQVTCCALVEAAAPLLSLLGARMYVDF